VLDLFGSGGGLSTANRLNTPLLGSIPLSAALREAGDEGIPLVISHPEDHAAVVLGAIAASIVTAGKSRARKNLPLSTKTSSKK
jgi:ATP-binding protein involved in chromosome partitioning